MAITFVEKQKTERKQLLMVGLVLIITGIVVWWGFFREASDILDEDSIVIPKKQIKIDFEVFETGVFQKLQSFSIIELSTTTEESAGRENPFLPY